MTSERERNEFLRALFGLSSLLNVLAGLTLLALVATGVTAYPGHRFPIIAMAVGGVLLMQGVYGAGYAQDWWESREGIANGAMLAGQMVAWCAALLTIYYAIVINPRAANGGVEPGPFFSGVLIALNALLALTLLYVEDGLTPKTRARGRT